jgi:hypothetical protein
MVNAVNDKCRLVNGLRTLADESDTSMTGHCSFLTIYHLPFTIYL